jgi:GNAT superfamily N-acetyltransferase
MDITIREPTAHDAADLAELHVGSWREAYGHLLPSDFFSTEYVEGRHRMWEHLLTHPDDQVMIRVAESDGRIVGFAWAGPGFGAGDEAPSRPRQLYAIYLAASHYGSGAAQALLDATIGAEPAMLWVAKENPRATTFYVRNGFAFDGVEQVDPYAPSITDARMVR